MLETKHERIPDLVDRNYNIIDTYYEDHGGVDNVSRKTKKNYEKTGLQLDEFMI